MPKFSDWMWGKSAGFEKASPFSQEQQNLLSQLIRQLRGEGEGGGYSENPMERATEEDLMGIISDDPAAWEKYERPHMTKYEEEIIPGLAERYQSDFGGTSNSGFRNAALREGSNLRERLAEQRAKLKHGARQQILDKIKQMREMALGKPVNELAYRQSTEGFASGAGKAAIGAAASGGNSGGKSGEKLK